MSRYTSTAAGAGGSLTAASTGAPKDTAPAISISGVPAPAAEHTPTFWERVCSCFVAVKPELDAATVVGEELLGHFVGGLIHNNKSINPQLADALTRTTTEAMDAAVSGASKAVDDYAKAHNITADEKVKALVAVAAASGIAQGLAAGNSAAIAVVDAATGAALGANTAADHHDVAIAVTGDHHDAAVAGSA